jgi:hypothetical protein
MVLVHVFDEGLDVSFSDKLLLAVGSFDLQKFSSDACDEEVREAMFLYKC